MTEDRAEKDLPCGCEVFLCEEFGRQKEGDN